MSVTTQTAALSSLPNGTAISTTPGDGGLVQVVQGPLTDTQLRASAVPVSDGGGSLTVDGPLTDTQLRATPVPVSGPLTDTLLRATPVPVSGTVSTGGLTDTQLRATAVPVSGPLTDTQLRATAVPVSGPLTDTQLRATAVPVSGPLTDSALRATPVPVSGTVSTGGLTDTQLRATPVPVSGTVTITDGSGPVTVDGTVAVSSVGSITSALPAGTNALGKVQHAEPGRANVSLYAEAVAGIIAETPISMNKSTQFAAAAAATSNGPSAAKNLRIYAMVISWVSTSTTANTCRVRLRVNPSAAATTASPIAYTARIAWESPTFIANEGEFQFIPLDIDIPSGGQIMATLACVAANGTLDIQLLAYEYTP